MKHLVAKVMISLACAVIMLHAVVPHHHHDCCGEVGFVFENEMACHCDESCHDMDCEHHHGHSHHPFDICLLQDMLSHLTLSNTDDRYYFTALIQAEAQGFLQLFLPSVQCDAVMPLLGTSFCRLAVAVLPPMAPEVGVAALRAPPLF